MQPNCGPARGLSVSYSSGWGVALLFYQLRTLLLHKQASAPYSATWMWLVSRLTSKSRLWLSDYIFANHLVLKSQCTCIQTAWTRGLWNMLPLPFSCRQGSTGDEKVFSSNDNWNLRIKRLEGIFSTILTSGVDYGENNMMNCNYSSWKVF